MKRTILTVLTILNLGCAEGPEVFDQRSDGSSEEEAESGIGLVATELPSYEAIGTITGATPYFKDGKRSLVAYDVSIPKGTGGSSERMRVFVCLNPSHDQTCRLVSNVRGHTGFPVATAQVGSRLAFEGKHDKSKNAIYAVSAHFWPLPYQKSYLPTFDVDGDGKALALSDGVIIMRFLNGLSGDELLGLSGKDKKKKSDVLTDGAKRRTAFAIHSYLRDLMPYLPEVNYNNRIDTREGDVYVKFLFGVRGDALIAGTDWKNADALAAELSKFLP